MDAEMDEYEKLGSKDYNIHTFTIPGLPYVKNKKTHPKAQPMGTKDLKNLSSILHFCPAI